MESCREQELNEWNKAYLIFSSIEYKTFINKATNRIEQANETKPSKQEDILRAIQSFDKKLYSGRGIKKNNLKTLFSELEVPMPSDPIAQTLKF